MPRPLAIDAFLPAWDIASMHGIEIKASAAKVFETIQTLDLGESRSIRLLFRLRGLPSASLTLRSLEAIRFALLADDPPFEMVFGIVFQFWTPSGRLKQIDPATFKAFAQAGYAKGVWNFSVTNHSMESVILRTETRVLCLDESSRRQFRRYWTFIRPFSGWIRTVILKRVKKAAERS